MSLAVAQTGDRLATIFIHVPKSGAGCYAPFFGVDLGPHLRQCGLPPYVVTSCSIQPCSHNTPMLQTGQDRQWSDSTRRTGLQTVPQKLSDEALSTARCKWFAYGPTDATDTPSSLASLKYRMVNLSGADLPRCPGKEAVKRVSVLWYSDCHAVTTKLIQSLKNQKNMSSFYQKTNDKIHQRASC